MDMESLINTVCWAIATFKRGGVVNEQDWNSILSINLEDIFQLPLQRRCHYKQDIESQIFQLINISSFILAS